jgi:hypothetical protein
MSRKKNPSLMKINILTQKEAFRRTNDTRIN